ncbi:MAG: hypothetical protein AAF594_17905 [Bacteroidota bacterium]
MQTNPLWSILVVALVGCGGSGLEGEWDIRSLDAEIQDADVGVRGPDGRLEVDGNLDVSLELSFDDQDDYGYTIDLSGIAEDNGDGDYTLDVEGDIDAGTGAFDYVGRLSCQVEGDEADCEGDLDATGDAPTYYGYYSETTEVETTLKITFQRR